MKKTMKLVARYGTLTAITIVAAAVMIYVNSRDNSAVLEAQKKTTAPVPIVARKMPLVAVEQIKPSRHEVTTRYSGKIRPWETYSIGFETGGRVVELGVDADGRALDDGGEVKAGQLLARIDTRALIAQRAEAAAQYEQTSADLRRAKDIRDSGSGIITESEFQQAMTDHELAKARLEIATKNLDDATLLAPVDATISRRLVEPGETVGANQTVFELVQNSDVLLVVDVPERNIRELEQRMRVVSQSSKPRSERDEADLFRARISLETLDRFGNKPPPIDGEVYRIAQVADSRTGLFEVEIRVPNQKRLLRPGMVAMAELVLDYVSAYKVPENAAIFRAGETYVFSIQQEPNPMQVMFWQLDQIPVATAHRTYLTEWIDQGGHLLVPTSAVELDQIVVRGQQRLSEGDHVRIVNPSDVTPFDYASPDGDKPGVASRASDSPNVE